MRKLNKNRITIENRPFGKFQVRVGLDRVEPIRGFLGFKVGERTVEAGTSGLDLWGRPIAFAPRMIFPEPALFDTPEEARLFAAWYLSEVKEVPYTPL